MNAELKRRLRTFGIGAACGFVVGAALVAVLITKYGPAAKKPVAEGSPRIATSSADGLADVDKPVLEERRPPAAVPTATLGDSTPTIRSAPPEALSHRKFEIRLRRKAGALVRSYDQRRSESRAHKALDILAPRNTPSSHRGRHDRATLRKQGRGITSINSTRPNSSAITTRTSNGTPTACAKGIS